MPATGAISEDTPFGVLEFLHWNHDWNNYKYPNERSLKKAIKLMKEAGVAWVRVDFLWGEIEPEEGRFDFEKYDRIVDLLVASGIRILGIWGYSAEWGSSCGKWNCPPADNRVFAAYAAETAKHFRGRVEHWELWNEPDSRTYWTEQDGLEGYCRLLKEVYTTVKREVPECRILNGGFANSSSSVNKLYDNGAKDYFDILNIHIFVSPLNPGAMKVVGAHAKSARKIMERNADSGKKIWVTEIGCPGVAMQKQARVKNWWLGENPNEAQQSEWVRDVYRELLQNPHVEVVFWAFFRDTDKHWKNGVDYFGLVRGDYSKKPSFFAYQKCVKNWKKRR